MILTVIAWTLAASAVIFLGIGYFGFPSNEKLMETIRNHQTEIADQQRVEQSQKDRIRIRLYMLAGNTMIAATFFAALH
jgi:hypothetical protein